MERRKYLEYENAADWGIKPYRLKSPLITLEDLVDPTQSWQIQESLLLKFSNLFATSKNVVVDPPSNH